MTIRKAVMIADAVYAGNGHLYEIRELKRAAQRLANSRSWEAYLTVVQIIEDEICSRENA